MARAAVFPRQVRQALTRTGGYLAGYTHTLQPYVGCEFSCHYCYVRALPVQRANPYGREWSRWISPKTDIAERLRAQGVRGTVAGARIFCASSTDPYTPLERKLGLTRACLDVFAEFPPQVLVVQTRSPLVLRDVDRLRALPRVGVSLTVTTDSEAVRRRYEPDSPRISRRIETLAALRAAGLRTQAAVAPLLPGDAEALAKRLDPVVDRVVVDDLVRGDGAGGARSRATRERLRAEGFGAWAGTGAADAAIEQMRGVLGPERVVVSQDGFNRIAGWLS